MVTYLKQTLGALPVFFTIKYGRPMVVRATTVLNPHVHLPSSSSSHPSDQSVDISFRTRRDERKTKKNKNNFNTIVQSMVILRTTVRDLSRKPLDTFPVNFQWRVVPVV